MNFFQKLIRRIEYGDYQPIKDFGQIHNETVGRERFSLKVKLLRGKSDWALRVDHNQQWGGSLTRSLFDLHFYTPQEAITPFRKLLRDAAANVTEPNFTQKQGLFEKMIMSISAGQIIRSYGQIDRHPKKSASSRIDLFLSWDGTRYWMLVREGEGSVEWRKWHINAAEALVQLAPRIEESMH